MDLELLTLGIGEIKEYEKNARINVKAVDAVVKSIKKNGYIAPIVVDENHIILAGHTRFKALKKLGYEEVECVVKGGLTEKQKKAYRIADNKTGEIAEWDFEVLQEELVELAKMDYDVESLGFSDKELNAIMVESLSDAEEYLEIQIKEKNPDFEFNAKDRKKPEAVVDTEYANEEKMFERPEKFKSVSELEFEHECPKCGFRW